jgi:hypothetical protein
LSFAELLKNQSGSEHMLVIKYEDFVQDQSHEIQRVAGFLGALARTGVSKEWYQTVSTGNSGRQSSQLKIRSRRPFGRKFIHGALHSADYRKLIELLGYPHVIEGFSYKTTINSFLHDVSSSVAKSAKIPGAVILRWVNAKSSSKKGV